jgi:hypothetical protein
VVREEGGVAKGSSADGRRSGLMSLNSDDCAENCVRCGGRLRVVLGPCLRRLPSDGDDLNEELEPVAFDARLVIALVVLSRAKFAIDSKLLRVPEGEEFPRPAGL